MAAIGAALSGRFSLAIVLIAIGALCDFLDGRVARRQGTSTRFGKEFDSLADVITFGVAPAVVIMIQHPRMLLFVAGGWYALCTAIRLARFNVQKEHSFRGLPSPLAGLCTITIIHLGPPTWVLTTVLISVGALMISPLSVPKL